MIHIRVPLFPLLQFDDAVLFIEVGTLPLREYCLLVPAYVPGLINGQVRVLSLLLPPGPEPLDVNLSVLVRYLTFPRNCGQSEKLVQQQQEDCHGFEEKAVYPRV